MLVCVVGTDSQKWTLSRRFFMVDNMLSTGTDTSGTEYKIFKLKISYILVYQIIGRFPMIYFQIGRRSVCIFNKWTVFYITGGAATSTAPQYVRYAKDIVISVTLDSTLGNGRIFPPLMTITYDQVSLANAQAGATITVCTASWNSHKFLKAFI